MCPELEVHASTQMTISSAEGAEFARSLGATRVVVPEAIPQEDLAKLPGYADASRDTLDAKLTRGGPTVIRPGIRQLQTVLISDTRRVLGGRISASWQERNANGLSGG